MKEKIKKGNAYYVEYLDAAYSYNAEEEVVPPIVTSLGFINDLDARYVNLALIIEGEGGKFLEGLIIPRKVILSIKPLNV